MKSKENNSVKKIAVFGGSFDPPHRGHISVIKRLSKRFDRVIVVPSFISPFKRDAKAASGEIRMKMLEAAVGGIDNVIISDYELKKGGVSYSAQTVEHFSREYKDDDIWFVIGTDMVERLDEWKDFDKLCSLCSFFVVKREGYKVDKDGYLVEDLREKGARIEFGGFEIKNYSSTLGRVSAAFGKSDIVGKDVLGVIERENPYAGYEEIFAAYKTFKMKKTRINHTYRTVKAAVRLAMRYGVDIDKTVTAAMLHDVGKYADEKTLEKNGVKVDKKVYSLPEAIVHAPIGAQIAKQYLGIKDKEIVDAIAEHTTGSPDMSALSKVIFLADYIEDGRSFENLDLIRKKAFESLDGGLIAALENTVDYLRRENMRIAPQTLEALEFYRGGGKTRRPVKKSGSLSYELAYTIAQYLDDKKARDITLIDLSGKTIIADYFVIATVGSTTAVRAITDFIDEKLSKDHGVEPLRRDIDSKWAAIDYGSVILHVQCEDTRKFYDLERLWSDGTNVERFGI